MQPTLEALVLGIIQGLTEFLPISSSAHLAVLPKLLGWEYFGKYFDVAAHLGTLLALLVYFWGDLTSLLQGALKKGGAERRLCWFILLSTIPALLFGGILSHKLESWFGGLISIGIFLIVFGLILGLADALGKKQKDFSQLKWPDALLFGIVQALALIPGVSRSGITITYGLAAGFNREAAARYSFLVSIPVIAAAGAYEGLSVLKHPQTFNLWPTLVVFITSFTAGFFCVKYFLQYLKSRNFTPFVIYRLALGGFILLLGCWK